MLDSTDISVRILSFSFCQDPYLAYADRWPNIDSGIAAPDVTPRIRARAWRHPIPPMGCRLSFSGSDPDVIVTSVPPQRSSRAACPRIARFARLAGSGASSVGACPRPSSPVLAPVSPVAWGRRTRGMPRSAGRRPATGPAGSRSRGRADGTPPPVRFRITRAAPPPPRRQAGRTPAGTERRLRGFRPDGPRIRTRGPSTRRRYGHRTLDPTCRHADRVRPVPPGDRRCATIDHHRRDGRRRSDMRRWRPSRPTSTIPTSPTSS